MLKDTNLEYKTLDSLALFPKLLPDEEVPRCWNPASDDCDGSMVSPESTTLYNESEDMMDDDMSLLSSGVESVASTSRASGHIPGAAISLKDLSMAREHSPQVQETLKRFGDWNETVKFSQRSAARLELRRRARSAALVEVLMEELSLTVADPRFGRALRSQTGCLIDSNEGDREEDNETMEFMSLVSAQSADSRQSAHGSTLRSCRSEVSETSSLTESRRSFSGRRPSKGLDSIEPKVPAKRLLAQRRLSLYLHSGDPFRASSSHRTARSAEISGEMEEHVPVVEAAGMCLRATYVRMCSTACILMCAAIAKTVWLT